jgi:hypothetical protein
MKLCPQCKTNPQVYKTSRLCRQCNRLNAVAYFDRKRGTTPKRVWLRKVNTTCTICKTTFKTSQKSLDKGWSKTCSRKCFHIRYGLLKKGKFSGSNYGSLHQWVRHQLGDPSLCTFCGKTEGKFEWSNISGNYKKDITDWQRLCIHCHRRLDLSYRMKEIVEKRNITMLARYGTVNTRKAHKLKEIVNEI